MLQNSEVKGQESDNVSRETRTEPRVRLTIFVNPKTISRIKTLETIYNEKPGRIVDRLIMTLWTGKALKLQHCVTGRSCQFNLPFPDQDIL